MLMEGHLAHTQGVLVRFQGRPLNREQGKLNKKHMNKEIISRDGKNLPSHYQVRQLCIFNLTPKDTNISCVIIGVHFFQTADADEMLVKYDIELWLGESNGKEDTTRMYNVESRFLTAF